MDSAQLLELIKKRRSIRSYLPDPIPDEHINKIFEAGLYAPSGKNRQPWRFFVIKEVKTIRSIVKSTTYSKFARNAPVMVLVFAKTDADYPTEKDLIGIGACLQNMMLTATAMGYGSCIVGELYGMQASLAQAVAFDADEYLLTCGLAVGKVKCTADHSVQKEVDSKLLLPKKDDKFFEKIF